MTIVEIFRTPSGDDGTFGNLLIASSGFRCRTVELPWRDNAPDISCIPPGTYIGRWLWSQKHLRFLFHLVGVPGRDVIEIHSANLAGDVSKGFVSQLLGCLAPGKDVAEFTHGVPPAGDLDQMGVTESKTTLSALHKQLGVSEDGKTAPDFRIVIH
jgi:hypothetical protein